MMLMTKSGITRNCAPNDIQKWCSVYKINDKGTSGLMENL